jgi:hypothetical protein
VSFVTFDEQMEDAPQMGRSNGQRQAGGELESSLVPPPTEDISGAASVEIDDRSASPSHGARRDGGLPGGSEPAAQAAARFASVADAIATQIGPRAVLDVGGVGGHLVAALRARGVEAHGLVLSEAAVADSVDAAAPFIRVGSPTAPIEGAYDLVTCLDTVGCTAIADAVSVAKNLAAAADCLLLSAAPPREGGATATVDSSVAAWSRALASSGLLRDFDHDASYVSPGAVLFRRAPGPDVAEVVYRYERRLSQLQLVATEGGTTALDLRDRRGPNASPGRAHGDEGDDELRMEILRLRDLVAGMEGQLGAARGRIEELNAGIHRYAEAERRLNDELENHRLVEQRLNSVLSSNSWRLTQAAGTPLRKLRERKG